MDKASEVAHVWPVASGILAAVDKQIDYVVVNVTGASVVKTNEPTVILTYILVHDKLFFIFFCG